MSLADQIKQRQRIKEQPNEKNPPTKSQTSNKSGLTQSVTFREPESNFMTSTEKYESSDTHQKSI